ncbi:MAG: hypothetical protein AAF789_02860 [Bacteroidota bacterium]
MVYRIVFVLFSTFPLIYSVKAQQIPAIQDTIPETILKLSKEVREIQLNLSYSQQKFKSGIAIATLGYTTTIAGGLMLGRSSDRAGQTLLVVGGVTGVIGTYKMIDAFSYLTGRKKKKRSGTIDPANF